MDPEYRSMVFDTEPMTNHRFCLLFFTLERVMNLKLSFADMHEFGSMT